MILGMVSLSICKAKKKTTTTKKNRQECHSGDQRKMFPECFSLHIVQYVPPVPNERLLLIE